MFKGSWAETTFKSAIKVKGPWRAHKYPERVSLIKRSLSTDSKSLKLHCGIYTQFNTMTTDGEMLFFCAPHPTSSRPPVQHKDNLKRLRPCGNHSNTTDDHRELYVTKLLSAPKLNPAESCGKECWAERERERERWREYVRIKTPQT